MSQAILFSGPDLALSGVESGALLIGCLFLTLAYVRTGLAEIDVYPSRAVLRSSLTVLIAGGYLFVVGVLAQLVRRFGGAESFQIQALVVLLGMAGLAVLLLSDRFRQRVHAFAARHFSRAQHDSVRIWSQVSAAAGASVKDQAGLCAASARFISETFDVLSVTMWLLDEEKEQLLAGASTASQSGEAAGGHARGPRVTCHCGRTASEAFAVRSGRCERALGGGIAATQPEQGSPRAATAGAFPCGPEKRASARSCSADRVNGAGYTIEELDLLKCIADQITSVLLNLRLANEVAHARELEAFRTMSAFFVHDLKNAAASLNLMLKNLPVHFDNPAFREDALRGVGNTARRIDDMIARLGALRQRPDFQPRRSRSEPARDRHPRPARRHAGRGTRRRRFDPLPGILADREQIQSVVTNLVLNARDALGPGGRIEVRTEHRGGHAVLSVADNGCGMSPAFLKESLFRPFQSTKKNGLGIGMFQSRVIVEAHGGSIHVESETGTGTTFRVSLPVNDEP